MSIILSIDTAVDGAFVSISKNGELIGEASNTDQKEQAGFLQPAIQQLLKRTGIAMQEMDAIALSAGPGSYTGLRVGMASAKGLCYALKKPLLTIGTLEIMAFAATLETKDIASLFCPMIDARRMEVFTALYDAQLQTILQPQAMVLDQDSFANLLLNNKICFFGNGSKKWETISRHPNAHFISIINNSLAMNTLAYKKYERKEFADLAYSEPFYLKEFFSDKSKN